MKRLLVTSLLALTLVIGVSGVFAPFRSASAQELGPDGCPLGTSLDAGGNCTAQGDDVSGGTTPGAVDPAAAQQAAEKIPTQNLTVNADPTKDFNGVIGWLFQIFAWLLGIAGLLLDNTVYYTVVTMGKIIGGGNTSLSAIGVAWKVLRDIGNIVLIFGFLAVGISTILGTGFYGARDRLPTLLIVAIFLNFSLFISEAVIDVGNLFATEFYTQINGGTPPHPIAIDDISNIKAEGISLKLMNQLGLQRILGEANVNPTDFFSKQSLIGVLGILLFMTAAFVMFSLSFILIARFVILVFLIIVAPVGFAGLAIPKLEGTAHRWWSALFNQTITAPVLLLMLYVALAVITDSQFLTGFSGGDLRWTCVTPSADCQGSMVGLLLSFLIAMGLLLVCTFMAKTMSAFGAEFATGIASKLSGAGLAFSATAGGTGWAGRRLIGMPSKMLSKTIGKSALGRSFVGRGMMAGLDKTAKASFDFRNSDTFKAGAKLAENKAGFSFASEGQKGGYKQVVEDKKKAYTEAAKAMEARGKTGDEQKLIDDAKAAEKAAKANAPSVVALEQARAEAAAKNAKYATTLQQQAELNKVNPTAARQMDSIVASAKAEADAAKESFDKLNNGQEALNDAIKERERIEGAIDTEVGNELKERQVAYAGRLAGRWQLTAGATDAAKEIKKSAGKTKKQALIDAVFEEVEKSAKTDKGGAKKEDKGGSSEAKPAADVPH